MSNEPEVKTLDFGTSKAAVPGEIAFNYSLRREENNNPPIAYLATQEFEDKIQQLKYALGNWDVLGLTGLSHSIVPILKNGIYQGALVGDDPSLTPLEGISSQWGSIYPEHDIAPKSSVRKMAGILQHPELLEKLFGKNHNGELVFSTLLSYTAWKLLGIDHNAIFPDDSHDFLKPTTLAHDQIAPTLGLAPQQLQFLDQEILRLGNKEVWVMQDVRADLKVMKELFDRYQLPAGAWVFATDSVLKRVRQQESSGTTSMEGLYYDTMRLMGNTGMKYVKPVMEARYGVDDVGEMYRKFDALMIDSTLPTDWLFNPRENSEKGQLWRRSGKSWQKISTDQLVQLSEPEIQAALRAYGWGMACGMYDGMPEEVSEVVLFGGLIGLHGVMQPGWRHAFVEAAPARCDVSWLKMPDSRVALELVIRKHKGEKIDYAQEVPLQPLRKGGGKVAQWSDMLYDIHTTS